MGVIPKFLGQNGGVLLARPLNKCVLFLFQNSLLMLDSNHLAITSEVKEDDFTEASYKFSITA